MTDPTPLSRDEKDQLRAIGRAYGDGAPYWWGRKTMPKLAARGFVEPHPDRPKAWRITDAGRAAYAELC
jgi:hypothetical protein